MILCYQVEAEVEEEETSDVESEEESDDEPEVSIIVPLLSCKFFHFFEHFDFQLIARQVHIFTASAANRK